VLAKDNFIQKISPFSYEKGALACVKCTGNQRESQGYEKYFQTIFLK
jgi:hypothetical protein